MTNSEKSKAGYGLFNDNSPQADGFRLFEGDKEEGQTSHASAHPSKTSHNFESRKVLLGPERLQEGKEESKETENLETPENTKTDSASLKLVDLLAALPMVRQVPMSNQLSVEYPPPVVEAESELDIPETAKEAPTTVSEELTAKDIEPTEPIEPSKTIALAENTSSTEVLPNSQPQEEEPTQRLIGADQEPQMLLPDEEEGAEELEDAKEAADLTLPVLQKAETHLAPLDDKASTEIEKVQEQPIEAKAVEVPDPNAPVTQEPVEGFGEFIDKYCGGIAPLGIGEDAADYVFTRSALDAASILNSGVKQPASNSENPLIVDLSLVQQSKKPSGAKARIAARRRSYARDALQARAVPDSAVFETSKKEEATSVQKNEEPPIESEAKELAEEKAETLASDASLETRALEELQESFETTPSPKSESSAQTTAEPSENVVESKAPVVVPPPKKPDYKLGVKTILVNGTQTDVFTYTDKTSEWIRVDEVLKAANHPGTKDSKKAAGSLAGFKNLRKIKTEGKGGKTQADIYVNETGLHKMLTKLEAKKTAQAKKTITNRRDTMGENDEKKSDETLTGEKEKPKGNALTIAKPHIIKLDSKGLPAITVKEPVGPEGGTSTINVDGKEVVLPTYEQEGEVWYNVSELLDVMDYKVGQERSKSIRKMADNSNVRNIRRRIGSAYNNFLHVNKEGLTRIIEKITSPSKEKVNKPSLPAPSAVPSTVVSPSTTVVPTTAVVSSQEVVAQPEEMPKSDALQSVAQPNDIFTVLPENAKGMHKANLRIIIDDHQLFVKGFTDDKTTWYATPKLLEFAGIIGDSEQRSFLARTVDPKEIREIWQFENGVKVLQPHVSTAALSNLVPALNKIVQEAKRPKVQPSHVRLPSASTEGHGAGWVPPKAADLPLTGMQGQVEGPAFRFGRERMDINHKNVTVTTINDGTTVWYEANSVLKAAGVPSEEDQTDLLNKLVTSDHKLRPFSGPTARTFVDKAGFFSVFEAIGAILGPTPSQAAETEEDMAINETTTQTEEPARLGESFIELLGHQIKVKTAVQDGNVWFNSNDIATGFNKFQTEEGGLTVNSAGFSKFVKSHVNSDDIRILSQIVPKIGIRLSQHVNAAGLQQLERALEAKRSGKQVVKVNQPKYPDAQAEVNAIADKLHKEQEKQEEKAVPKVIPTIQQPQPTVQTVQAQPPVPPTVPPVQAQQPVPAQQSVPPLPEQTMAAPYNPPQQQPLAQPQPQSVPNQISSFLRPQASVPQQPNPHVTPNFETSMPLQTHVRNVGQPAAPVETVEVIPVLGVEAPVRKKIETDGAWYSMQDLLAALGIPPNSPVGAMFANYVRQGSFRAFWSTTPFGVEQSMYVNSMGLVEILNELEASNRNNPFASQALAPQYPQAAPMVQPQFGISQPIQPQPMNQPYVQPVQPQTPIQQNPFNQPGQFVPPVQQQQPRQFTAPQQPIQSAPTSPVPEEPEVKPIVQTAKPVVLDQPVQAPKAKEQKVAKATKVVKPTKPAPIKYRESNLKVFHPVLVKERTPQWIKEEERGLGVFPLDYEGKKIRFAKDSNRQVYVCMRDVSEVLGRTSQHTESAYFDQNDFVKVFTPLAASTPLMTYMGQRNLQAITSRSGPEGQKFYRWFEKDALTIVQSNAPTTPGL